jgi:hypothetical protein
LTENNESSCLRENNFLNNNKRALISCEPDSGETEEDLMVCTPDKVEAEDLVVTCLNQKLRELDE